ncbi:MAG: RHS repeat protein, partial [Verrucomicrobiales bacterium]|nr:RHS repeat protein [Verrucomicrobiales bacterium]
MNVDSNLNQTPVVRRSKVRANQRGASLIGLVPILLLGLVLAEVAWVWGSGCCGGGGQNGNSCSTVDEASVSLDVSGEAEGSITWNFGGISGTTTGGENECQSITGGGGAAMRVGVAYDYTASAKAKSVTFSLSAQDLQSNCGGCKGKGNLFIEIDGARKNSVELKANSGQTPGTPSGGGGQCSREGCTCPCKPPPTVPCPTTEDCPDCEDGTEPCDQCDGDGYNRSDCSDCEGGTINVPGYPCDDCLITINPFCGACGGDGEVGEYSTDCYNENCEGGEIKEACGNCVEGIATCETCKGTRVVDCIICNGTGEKPDPDYPGGSGSDDCICKDDDPNTCQCACCSKACELGDIEGSFIIQREAPKSGTPGDGDPATDSLHWSAFVGGTMPDGAFGGWLTLSEEDIPSVIRVDNLKYATFSEDVEQRGSQFVDHRQIKTPQVLIEMVEDEEENEVKISFYRAWQVVPNSGIGGQYDFFELSPGSTAYVTWTLKVLPHEAGEVGQFLVIQKGKLGNRQTHFVQHAENAADGMVWTVWNMEHQNIQGEVLKTETKKIGVNNDQTQKKVIFSIHGPDGEVVQRSLTSYEDVLNDGVLRTVSKEEYTGTEGIEGILRTEWQYETDLTSPGYGKLKWQIDSDGSWIRYDYVDPETNQRCAEPVVTYQPAWDGPADPEDATLNNCRVERRVFSTPAGRQASPNELIRTDYFIKGVKMSEVTHTRSEAGYLETWTDVRSLPRISPDGEGYEAAGASLMEQTVRYQDRGELTYSYARPGTDEDGNSIAHLISRAGSLVGEVKRRVNADGTASFFQHEFGEWNKISKSFNADSDGTHLKTVEIRSIAGEPNGVSGGSTKQLTITDATGRRVHFEESIIPKGGGAVTTRVEDYSYNDEGNLTSVIRDGELVLTQTWRDKFLTNRIDERGAETRFEYDALGQLLSETIVGLGDQPDVVTSYTYDAAGRQLSVTRAAGGLLEVSSATYDLAGRVLSRTSPDGATVTYSYEAAGRTITETGADGLTRVTTRTLDGRVSTVTGTKQPPSTTTFSVETAGSLAVLRSTETRGSLGQRVSWREVDHYGYELRSGVALDDGDSESITSRRLDAGGRPLVVFQTAKVPEIYTYDLFGRVVFQGSDLDGSGEIELASNEPLTWSSYEWVNIHSAWWELNEVRSFSADNDGQTSLKSSVRRRLGLPLGSIEERVSPGQPNVTTEITIDRANATVVSTVSTQPLGGGQTSTTVNGQLVSVQRDGVDGEDTMTYDALGRRLASVQGGTGYATAVGYDEVGRIATTTDASGAVTSYAYYPTVPASPNAGRLKTITDALGRTTHYAYGVGGQITHQWGSASYPLRYEYDEFGQMTQLHTYRGETVEWAGADLPGAFETETASVTTWTYGAATGRLLEKLDAASAPTSYSYDEAGRLLTRTWARGTPRLTTTYSYDELGRVTSTSSSDESITPSTSSTYDRLGRVATLTDAAGTHHYTYDATTGALVSETVDGGGVWNGLSLSWDRDSAGRLTAVGGSLGSLEIPVTGYNWSETHGGLSAVTFPEATVRYEWDPSASQVTGWSYQTASSEPGAEEGPTWLSAIRTLDGAGRLDAIRWRAGAGSDDSAPVLSLSDYTLDALGRRVGVLEEDGRGWAWSYNDRGEVISAVQHDAAGLPQAGGAYGYAYDAIGNRLGTSISRAVGEGSTWTSSLQANALNQIVSRQNPGVARLMGRAVPEAEVIVNAPPPLAKAADGSWAWEVETDNSAGPVWQAASVTAQRAGAGMDGKDLSLEEPGALYVPPAQEVMSYDEDGNLLSDGRWTYQWDNENRLIQMQTT